jgi:hypothetical protein
MHGAGVYGYPSKRTGLLGEAQYVFGEPTAGQITHMPIQYFTPGET